MSRIVFVSLKTKEIFKRPASAWILCIMCVYIHIYTHTHTNIHSISHEFLWISLNNVDYYWIHAKYWEVIVMLSKFNYGDCVFPLPTRTLELFSRPTFNGHWCLEHNYRSGNWHERFAIYSNESRALVISKEWCKPDMLFGRSITFGNTCRAA